MEKNELFAEETSQPPHRRHPRKIEDAMRLLFEGHCYAEELHNDPWQFAVEIADLKEVGLNNTDLRWLKVMEYVIAAKEITADTADQRVFEYQETTSLCPQTCFIPTPKGLRFAQNLLAHGSVAERVQPVWDPALRELRVMGKVVKRFQRPSCNQQRVIEVFQEEDWRVRIDDPLPRLDACDPKRRLRQTIKALNRNQKTRLIRFSGDGTGEGVCWQVR